MIANAQRICHDRQTGIHRPDRYKKTCVDDIEVIQVMRFAIQVESRCLGVVAETHSSGLMCRSTDRDVLAQIELPRYQLIMAADVGEHLFELCRQPVVSLQVDVFQARA